MAEIELQGLGRSEKKSLDLERGASKDYMKKFKNACRKKLITAFVFEISITSGLYFEYRNIGEKFPLVANIALGASCGALAQTFAQVFRNSFSIRKIVKFVLWGALNGALTELWVGFLLLHINTPLMRIILDQTLGTPVFQAVFSILNSVWDHGRIVSEIKELYIKSLKWSYLFWPFFSVLQFLFIPSDMIFPANCIASLVWNILLSRLS